MLAGDGDDDGDVDDDDDDGNDDDEEEGRRSKRKRKEQDAWGIFGILTTLTKIDAELVSPIRFYEIVHSRNTIMSGRRFCFQLEESGTKRK